MYVCERFKGNELYVIFWNIRNQFLISVIRSGVHRGISIGEAIATPPPPAPPIIFLIFVLQNITKLVLQFTFAAISICPGNKTWSIYELPPDCTLLFSLVFTMVLNWKIIIFAIINISVIIVLSNKKTGSDSKIYRNCFYIPFKERTLRNPWVKSFSCIKMTSRGTSWRCSWRLSGTFLNQKKTTLWPLFMDGVQLP